MVVEIGWATTDHHFRAMGTDCHVMVVGPDGKTHTTKAEQLVQRLERLWSRFDPDSEVSRLRLAEGETVTVTPETFALIEKSVLAWQMTGGRFDPTMADRLSGLGYDKSFEQIESEKPMPPVAGSSEAGSSEEESRAPGCSEILLSRQGNTVRLPAGMGFDPGGIGKGLAADIVSQELMDRGAWGVMVNLGGDLRVRGTPPSGDAWVVAIKEPTVKDGQITTVRLVDCGLATSTTKKRRWVSDGQEQHHLLDPETGDPVHTEVDLVSVIAGEAWWAEVAATALIADETPLTPPGCAALRVLSDGTMQRLADFEGYEA